MDGSNPMTSVDLDRELTAALRVEPSPELRVRVRARIAGARMNASWRWLLRVGGCAGTAGLVIAAAGWNSFESSSPADLTRSASRIETIHRQPLAPPRSQAVIATTPLRPVKVAQRLVRARRQLPLPAVGAAVREPEVLLSESERDGVRMLLDSVASGRLELPHEMLRDLSLPIVQAGSSLIPVIELSPNHTGD